MTVIRRLDHVGIAVRDTGEALRYFSGHLGLRVHHSEEVPVPPVRLTYLDAGNAWVQLVEPLDEESAIAQHLRDNGEGVHHVCFGVDDVLSSAAALAIDPDAAAPVPGSGRGRPSAFVPGTVHGVQIECTEFRRQDDVDDSAGWLP
jgi:methylmalonyl-CoA/ethylmalonyl-CoA epimerase